jgi:16S rRNA (guanine966-N2)-methyltransferase
VTRIIAGTSGGRRLVVPAGALTRPTSDRVREALFSRLEHQEWLDGTAVLDLFAGSGALGLEAASRGAGSVVLVEQAPAALRALLANMATLGLAEVRPPSSWSSRPPPRSARCAATS